MTFNRKVGNGTIECKKCCEMKHRTEFYKNGKYVRSECKDCIRASRGQKKRFKRKITLDEMQCNRCREMKPKSEYSITYVNKDMTAGYNSYCDDCTRVLAREWARKRLGCKPLVPRLRTKYEIECKRCHSLVPYEQFYILTGGSVAPVCKPCLKKKREAEKIK